jgi:hypothetical protein
MTSCLVVVPVTSLRINAIMLNHIALLIAFFVNFQLSGGSGPRNPNQAVEVISTMLAKGFVLGKDAVGKAKEFDEKHDLSSSAKSSVVNFDKNVGISEKLSAGTAVVNQQMKAVDEKYQVSEKTRAALAVAEEKVATAGSALMKNRYILTGTCISSSLFHIQVLEILPSHEEIIFAW